MKSPYTKAALHLMAAVPARSQYLVVQMAFEMVPRSRRPRWSRALLTERQRIARRNRARQRNRREKEQRTRPEL